MWSFHVSVQLINAKEVIDNNVTNISIQPSRHKLVGAQKCSNTT